MFRALTLAAIVMSPHVNMMVRYRIIFVLRLCVLQLVWQSLESVGLAGDSTNLTATFDVAGPAWYGATLYEIGSHRGRILYYFERTSTRSGSIVHVQRQFKAPDGSVAAMESGIYESNRLVSYQMKEFQAKLSGSVQIEPDPDHPGQQIVFIGYGKGLVHDKGKAQTLKPDTLIDDDLYPFMLAHWDDLIRGEHVKFRLVSIEWQHIFNFQLVITGETVVDGKICELICMKPTSFLLEKVVDPIIFTVEKARPHIMISYIGQTTPRVKKDNSWQYLAAETVFYLNPPTPLKNRGSGDLMSGREQKETGGSSKGDR